MTQKSDEKARDTIIIPIDPSTSFRAFAEAREQGNAATVAFADPRGKMDPQQIAALMPFFKHDHVFIARYDEVHATLADPRFSNDARSTHTQEQAEKLLPITEELVPVARALISLDPPDHTRLRKLIQPSFLANRIELLRPRIQMIVNELLDAAEQRAEERGEARPNRCLNIIDELSYLMPATVICEILGIPPEDRKQVLAWTEPLIRADRRGAGGVNTDSRVKIGQYIDYLRELFRKKRENPADDMISELLAAEEEGQKLTMEEVLATVNLLFIAGNITTVGLIGSAIYALLLHPEELAKLRADFGLIKNTIEEALRYWGPVDLLTRRIAKEDIEIDGIVIPKGEPVLVGLASANRDPARFPDADKFDITRKGAEGHVAFGRGIHFCVGAPLARLEGQIAVETVFRRYPEIRLAVRPEELRFRLSFMRGLVRLPVWV